MSPGRNPKSLAYWQKRILWGATFAYTIYHFCRVNISIALSLMQTSLGVSKTELGFVASALQIAYGLGKFANGVTLWDGLRGIVGNQCLWALAMGSLFLHVVRYGLLTWSASFLIASRGMSTVAAGWLSDLTSKGRRGPVMAAYMLLVSGPLMLVSVAAAGYVSPNLAESASGLAGLLAYIGATVSGAALGAAAEYAGWHAVFALLTTASLLSAAYFAFTMRAPAPRRLRI